MTRLRITGMSWSELFERGESYETSVEAVVAALEERRNDE